jgi:hypothetical protein
MVFLPPWSVLPQALETCFWAGQASMAAEKRDGAAAASASRISERMVPGRLLLNT